MSYLAAIVCSLAASVACADEASIRKAVQAKFPHAKVQTVTKLPYLGLYEVVINDEILYADENFDYIIYEGNIIETKTDRNLTEERKRKLAMIPFDELPLELAFKKVKGKGERKIAGVLRSRLPVLQAHRGRSGQARQRDHLHVPVPDRRPASTGERQGRSASGARRTRSKPGTTTCSKGIAPTAAPTCDNPVDKLVEFGSSRGINATPTLVFANGDRVPGAISAAQIEKLMSGGNCQLRRAVLRQRSLR